MASERTPEDQLLLQLRAALLFTGWGLSRPAAEPDDDLPLAQPNDQRETAGQMVDGKLRVELEAVLAEWRPRGPDGPRITTPADALGDPAHDHEMQQMGGLVLGTTVEAPTGWESIGPPPSRRIDRFTGVREGVFRNAPELGFVVQEGPFGVGEVSGKERDLPAGAEVRAAQAAMA